jgi:hypothetical protein
MRLAASAFFLWILLLAEGAAAEDCLPYEPAVVQITGTLHKVKAYGPPNYGENPATDSREDYIALKLDQPACTLPSGNNIDLPEVGIKEVQLVFMGKVRTAPVGQHGTVTGKLMHAIIAHHHTTVLIMVE